MTEKKITCETREIVKRNPDYPKVRYVCGEFQRIKNPDAVLERYERGDWKLLSFMK